MTAKRPKADAATPWSVERRGTDALSVTFDVPKGMAIEDWSFPILLSSDRHHDHPKCDQRLEKKHLDEVESRGGAWMDAGDLTCGMQSKYDGRHTKDGVRDEYQVGDYFNALSREAIKFYGPYSRRCIAMSPGNHESFLRDKREVDVVADIVHGLRTEHGSAVEMMPYKWWCTIRVRRPKGGESAKLCMWVHHGYGGGGPVNRGEQQFQRAIEQYRADVYWMGHIHEARLTERVIGETTLQDHSTQRTVYCVRTPTYKDEMTGGNGWAVQKGLPPKPLGAWWMVLTLDWRGPKRSLRIVPRFERAD